MHTSPYLQEDILWDLKHALSLAQMSCAFKAIKIISTFDGGLVFLLNWAI
jgi:hypothetical protein